MTNSAMSTFAHVISVFYAGGTEPRFDMKIERLTNVARAVAAGVRVSFRKFMVALHDTRRQQAALELERWRHLTPDDERDVRKNQSTTKDRK